MAGQVRRITGAVILLVAIPIAALSFALGHIVDGWDSPDIQCSHLSGRPPIPVDVEGERGGWSVFPLGVACTFDAPGDGVPPQTIVHADWPATVVWVLSSFGVVVGLVMATVPERWLYKGRAR
jgi:hypothetical protein